MAAEPDRCLYWDNAECVGTVGCPPRCPRFFDDEGTLLLARHLRPDDRGPLVEMYEALDPDLRTMGLPPDGNRQLRAWIDRLVERGWNLLALDGDRVIGHVGVAPADAADPEFVVFVHQDYLGRGIGRELLRQTFAYAADRGHEELRLTVDKANRRAIAAYVGSNFEVRKRGLVDMEMELPLATEFVDSLRRPPAERTE